MEQEKRERQRAAAEVAQAEVEAAVATQMNGIMGEALHSFPEAPLHATPAAPRNLHLNANAMFYDS
eukprot:5601899-Prymnesium_polylepis.1